MRTTPSIPRRAATEPPPPLLFQGALTLDDRIAAYLHLYRDLIAAQRRRVLIWLGLVVFFVVLTQMSMVWSDGGRRNPALLWHTLIDSLAGPLGVLLGVILLIGCGHYFSAVPLARRRLRRWLRLQGFRDGMEYEFRLHSDGVDVSGQAMTSHMPGWRLAAITTGPERALIDITNSELVMILPLRDMPAAQRQALEEWAAQVVGAPAPAMPDDGPAAPDGSIDIAYDLSLEDRVVLLQRQQAEIWPAWKRLRNNAIGIAVVLLAAPALMAVFWAVDPHRVPLRFAAPLFAEIYVTQIMSWHLGFVALALLGSLAGPWLRRKSMEGLAGTLRDRYGEPKTRITFTPDAVTTVENGLRNRNEWAGFRAVERAGEELLFRRHVGEPLSIPLRVLTSDQIDALDSLARAKIDATTQEGAASG